MKLLCIGGAPCAGKSTTARALADEFGLRLCVLDDLREDFHLEKNEERHHYPWIFSSVGVSAETYWQTRTPADVLRGEIEQAREFWPHVKKLITEQRYDILEGVSLLPELLWADFGDTISACFLVDENRERVRHTIQTRGLWGDAASYPDWIKEKEVEWVMLHNAWFREQAKRYPYPVLAVGEDRDTTLSRLREILASSH